MPPRYQHHLVQAISNSPIRTLHKSAPGSTRVTSTPNRTLHGCTDEGDRASFTPCASEISTPPNASEPGHPNGHLPAAPPRTTVPRSDHVPLRYQHHPMQVIPSTHSRAFPAAPATVADPETSPLSRYSMSHLVDPPRLANLASKFLSRPVYSLATRRPHSSLSLTVGAGPPSCTHSALRSFYSTGAGPPASNPSAVRCWYTIGAGPPSYAPSALRSCYSTGAGPPASGPSVIRCWYTIGARPPSYTPSALRSYYVTSARPPATPQSCCVTGAGPPASALSTLRSLPSSGV